MTKKEWQNLMDRVENEHCVMVKAGDHHYIEISRYEGDASCTYLFEGVDTDSYGNEIDRYFLDEGYYLDNYYYLFTA